MINKDKSCFYVYSKTAHSIVQTIEDCTGFIRGKFPLTYLGCPIGPARKRKSHFSDITKKVQSKYKLGRVNFYILVIVC